MRRNSLSKTTADLQGILYCISQKSNALSVASMKYGVKFGDDLIVLSERLTILNVESFAVRTERRAHILARLFVPVQPLLQKLVTPFPKDLQACHVRRRSTRGVSNNAHHRLTKSVDPESRLG